MPKMRIIREASCGGVSEIKLKRTDTTLDLSQKAKRAGEKEEREERDETARQFYIAKGGEEAWQNEKRNW